MLRLQGSGHFHETVPVLDEQGHMAPEEVERELDVDIALRWGTGYDTDGPLLRQHHRDAQGRHPSSRASSAAWSALVNEQLRATKLLAPARTPSSRTTRSRA